MTGGAEDRRDGSQLLRDLDRLRRDDLQALTRSDLSRLVELLEHWRQLAQLERDRRVS